MIGLTGALLPAVSFLGRLPTATIQMGSVLLVAETSGSLGTGGAVGCALALGQVAMGPYLGRLADRRGQRRVVLCFALLNAVLIAAFTLAALLRLPTWALILLGALAGASQPGIGPLARARVVALARARPGGDRLVATAFSLEGTMDELSFVLGPALVGIAAVAGHPAYAFVLATLLVAGCGTAFALHPSARQVPVAVRDTSAVRETSAVRDVSAVRDTGAVREAGTGGARNRQRTPALSKRRMPPSVYIVRTGLVLLGFLLGACGAGITALTRELGQPGQAGLVYAAMGVMSAAVGLAMAALPARFGLRLRWRLATAAAALLSLPLIWTGSLAGLYLVVTVFGAVYAPNLITGFALTERAVPEERLAEGMTFAVSAFTGGQAVMLAVAGRLAEAHGAQVAFAIGSAAAACAFLASLAVRRPRTPVVREPEPALQQTASAP